MFSSDELQCKIALLEEGIIELLEFKDDIKLAITNSNKNEKDIENGLDVLNRFGEMARKYFSTRKDRVLKLFPFWEHGYDILKEVIMTTEISFTVHYNEDGSNQIDCLKYDIKSIDSIIGRVEFDSYHIDKLLNILFEDYYKEFIRPLGFNKLYLAKKARVWGLNEVHASQYLNIKFNCVENHIPDIGEYLESKLLQIRESDI